jgi:tetratricopeptide (TPR) repeat protein
MALDPLSLPTNKALGEILIGARRYDEAMEALQRGIDMDPRFPGFHLLLGQVYLMKGMYEAAIKEFEYEKSLGEVTHIGADALIGGTYAYLGEMDKTRRVLTDILERSKKEHISKYSLAGVYFTLGETDRAFELLEEACEEHDPMLFFLKTSPMFDYMRSDPRAKAVLRKMNLDK